MMQAVYVMRRRNPMTHSPILRIYAQITGSWQRCFWSLHDVWLLPIFLLPLGNWPMMPTWGLSLLPVMKRQG